MNHASEQEERSFVLFRLGSEEFGIAIEKVRSIVRYEPATPVPRAPEMVQGVVNLRGQVIPLLDLSHRLRQVEFVPTPTSRIIVAEGEAGIVGLAVDEANEVASIPVASIKPPPDSVLTEETAQVFEGVTEREDGLVILLDLDEAVPRTEYAHVIAAEAAQEGGPDV